MICSLDPGLQGAVAVLSNDGQIIAVRKMPLDKRKKFSATNTWELLKGIDDYAKGLGDSVHCAIEKLLSMPSDTNKIKKLVEDLQIAATPELFETIYKELKKTDGRTGTLTMGINWGILKGQIAALGWPCTVYSPRSWMAKMHKTADGKQTSKLRTYEVCCQLWPDKKELWEKKRGFDDGITDALVIGEHHRRELK